MKKLIFALALAIISATSVSAQNYGTIQPTFGGNGSSSGIGSNPNSHYVSPYTRNDGTQVQGHYQTNPNGTQLDNYGTRGNQNPYTGQYGTHSPRY
jgi:hypothetical protein